MLLCSASLQFTWEYFSPKKPFLNPKPCCSNLSCCRSSPLCCQRLPSRSCLISVLWLAAGDLGSWKSLRRDPGGGWDLQRICCQENGHWPQRAGVRDDPQWKQRPGPPGCHRYDLTGVATWGKLLSMVLSLTANTNTKEHFLQWIAESILNCLVRCNLFANSW